MKSVYAFVLILALIAIIVFATGFTSGEIWFWAVGNALGFLALAALFYLSMDARNGAKISTHQAISYAVFGLVIAHGLWFLLGDTTVIEYLKPGSPAYMWSGVLAFFLIGFLLFGSTRLARRTEYSDAASFRLWHKWVAIGVLITSIYHIAGSGFYLNNSWQWILLSGATAFAFMLSRAHWFKDSNPVILALTSFLALAAFVVIRVFSA